jgi:molecular chaperone GrpE
MHDPRRRRIRIGGFEPAESDAMTERSHPSQRRFGDGPNASPQPPRVNTASDGPTAGSANTGGGSDGPGNTDRDGPGVTAAQAASATAAHAASNAEIERLTAELETAQQQAAELLSGLQRERAEFQNFRRRTTEEREREAGLAGDYLLKKVLSIADDFDRAIEARPADLAGNPWAEGIGAIDRKLRGLLESEGVQPIEAVGKPFDPRQHEAITSVPATGRPEGEVIAEVQRGYRIRDRILRPALVAVAAGGAGETSTAPDSADGAGNPQTNDNTNRPN